jgi:hexulose-6-phosphate isomerase
MNFGRNVTRRDFLAQSSSLAFVGAMMGTRSSATLASSAPWKKAACIGVLPDGLSVLQKFQLAKTAGFEGIEPNTLNSAKDVQECKEAAESTGVRIHSIMNSDHWKFPLTDNDPEVVRKCIEGIKTSMHNAHDLGADTVLLVPGIVTPEVGYADVYQRSQERIRELIPLAEELKVIIAVENVGNRFLQSPLEFARYVDEFKSPWVRAYFDIGNVVSIGYPPDWIRILGKRLVKVHIKRFEPGTNQPKFDPKDRRTQGVDWAAVYKALTDVGYAGWLSAEVRSGDEAYVREVSRRLDSFFSGQDPS